MQKKIIEMMVERAEKTLSPEILEKIEKLDIHEITGSGYDEFGLNKDQIKIFVKASMFAYNTWFRAETFNIDRIPTKGPAIIVPNHSGQLPLDGMMIAVACLTQLENPRLPRAMVEKWFPTLPVVSLIFARAGQVPGFIENAEKLLTNEELLMIFPEVFADRVKPGRSDTSSRDSHPDSLNLPSGSMRRLFLRPLSAAKSRRLHSSITKAWQSLSECLTSRSRLHSPGSAP